MIGNDSRIWYYQEFCIRPRMPRSFGLERTPPEGEFPTSQCHRSQQVCRENPRKTATQ